MRLLFLIIFEILFAISRFQCFLYFCVRFLGFYVSVRVRFFCGSNVFCVSVCDFCVCNDFCACVCNFCVSNDFCVPACAISTPDAFYVSERVISVLLTMSVFLCVRFPCF